jgi:hypothetical protein
MAARPLTIRPVVVLILMAVHALFIATGIKGRLGWPGTAINLVFGVTGYLLAFVMSLQIAREHARCRPMRIAWLAFGFNSLLWVFAMITGGWTLRHLAPDVFTQPLLGLMLHLAVVPADVLLLAGMLFMWWGFRSAAIGFRLRTADYLCMAVLVVSMAGILVWREQLTEANSPYPGVKGLQQAGLVLLSLAAAASLVQRRFALEIGHSRLALALQFLALHAIGRCVLVFLDAGLRASGDPSETVLASLASARTVAHWSITIAASYRVALAADAARQISQLGEMQAAAKQV